jgi:hypothetical protein
MLRPQDAVSAGFLLVCGRMYYGQMAALPSDAVQKARDRVARSAHLMDRQEATIQALERSGADTRLACALLYTMYRSRLLMIEYLDRLGGAESAACEPPVLGTALRERRRESLDDWLQLLTLAMNPSQGPHGPH